MDLDEVEVGCEDSVVRGADDLVALDGALTGLEHVDARKAHIVVLRYFAGLTIEETAKAMGLSLATVKEEWRFARAWLYGEMCR